MQLLNRSGFWIITARIAWPLALAVCVVRFCWGGSHRAYAFNDYLLAGLHWMRGENLYTNWRGFIYSPTLAALFAPLSCPPSALAYSLWLMINAAALLGGLAALFKTNLFPCLGQKSFGISCLLLLPLGIGNLDVGQANPLVIGLLMFAIAAVRIERWNTAALCVAIATFFKIYPLALGLLICVIAPRRFIGRLAIALLLLAVAPFLFQHWSYVQDQYHAWIDTRISDNRIYYPERYVPIDLWFLLHWVCQLPVTPAFYTLIQVGSGAALALFSIWATRKRWNSERVLSNLFFLAPVWMTLCGPATEAHTYLLLGPTLVLAVVHSLQGRRPILLRASVLIAFVLQLLNHERRILYLFDFKHRWVFSAQPLSALLLLGYCFFWLFNDSFWREAHDTSPEISVLNPRTKFDYLSDRGPAKRRNGALF
jgi:hypothetical protein